MVAWDERPKYLEVAPDVWVSEDRPLHNLAVRAGCTSSDLATHILAACDDTELRAVGRTGHAAVT